MPTQQAQRMQGAHVACDRSGGPKADVRQDTQCLRAAADGQQRRALPDVFHQGHPRDDFARARRPVDYMDGAEATPFPNTGGVNVGAMGQNLIVVTQHERSRAWPISTRPPVLPVQVRRIDVRA